MRGPLPLTGTHLRTHIKFALLRARVDEELWVRDDNGMVVIYTRNTDVEHVRLDSSQVWNSFNVDIIIAHVLEQGCPRPFTSRVQAALDDVLVVMMRLL